MNKRVLLLLPTTSYRNEAFLSAGKTLGVEIAAAADYCHRLAPGWGMAPLMALHFDRPRESAEIVLRELHHPPDAVLAVDDLGLELAALLNERLGLPGNPPEAVRRLRDKLAFRRLLRAKGFNCPRFHSLAHDEDPTGLLPRLHFPLVVKARRLSASRGVIRCDDAEQYLRAAGRVRQIQDQADRDSRELGLVVEDFIPGAEFALEGLLDRGELRVLALFDKPDPLDGPYFEETIYVAPSRLPELRQQEIAEAVQRACTLAGLDTGPVHAEMRVNERGVWLLEVAARSIGGLCGRVLTHALGMPLEELILRHALGMAIPAPHRDEAAGVMMIPIPRRGIYRGVENLEAARAVPGIVDLRITAEPGQVLAPPPEGASYLGFLFSRGEMPKQAESALRLAHRLLRFHIRPEYPLEREDNGYHSDPLQTHTTL